MRPIWSVHKAAITQERLYGALRWQKKSDMTNTARFLKVIERFQSLQRFFGHFWMEQGSLHGRMEWQQ